MISDTLERRVLRDVGRIAARARTEQELLGSVSRTLQPAVAHQASAWLVTDPATMLFTDGVVDSFDDATCGPWFANELTEVDVHKFRDLVGGGAAVVSRLEDRAVSARWSRLMRPQGFDDELRLTLDDPTGCWAIVELHREATEADFAPDEVALLERLAPVLTAGLRRLAAVRAATANDTPDGPGLILVRDDDDAQPLTPAGAAWLELLSPTGGSVHRTNTAMLSLAEIVRTAAVQGRDLVDPRLRVRAGNGAWVTLHAEQTLARDGVAIVVEPSRPSDVAGILALAHGLSAREQEVALAVARGRSTSEIATELFLSPHTVRDHVKSCLRKIGVNSRSELVAALFDRHYAADFFATASAH